ncbi:hypothetical protein Tco_0615332 [Tanacetum coccineum]
MTDNTALLQALQAIQQQLQQQSQQLQQQLQQQSQQQIEHNTKILEALNIREQPKCDNSRYGSSSDEDEKGDQADPANQQRKRMPRIKEDIPTFSGSLNIEDFLDWVSETEKYFELMDIPEDSQVKYVAYKLRGAASSWWDNLQTEGDKAHSKSEDEGIIICPNAFFEDDDDHNEAFLGLVRRLVLASTKKSKDSQRHNIFQTRCKINQEEFNVIVDGGSNIVMSDSEDSTVTYTAVSSPFGGLSDIGSLGVDGPPVMPEDPYAYVVAAFQAPPSPNYVPGPEEPEQLPLSLEFVPEPVYPEFMPPKDGEYPGEDLIDYPADGGDDNNDDDESSDDDEDDNDDDVEEDEDEEEEEHPALADSVPPPIHRTFAIPSPPPSPLSLWSSPLPQIPSPPLPVSPPLPASPPPLPASPTYLLGYRAAMIRLRVETPSTSHLLPSSTPQSGTPPLLPIPLPTPSPPLLLPSTDCRASVSEVTLPPQKRLCIALDDEIRRDPERYVGYWITNTWEDVVEDIQGTPAVTDMAELSQRMTDFVTTVRHDTYEIYRRLDDVQDDRLLMSGWLNMLYRDRRDHARTALLIEREARLSCEAWGRSMDASDTARSEVRALRTTVLAHQTKIAALRVADRARQAQLMETLRLMSTLETQVIAL